MTTNGFGYVLDSARVDVETIHRYTVVDGPIVSSSTARSGRIKVETVAIRVDSEGTRITVKGIAVKKDGTPYDQRTRDTADWNVSQEFLNAWEGGHGGDR